MSGLTVDAAREVGRMLDAGWSVRYAGGGTRPVPVWGFTKAIRVRYGVGFEVAHGEHPDLYVAIETAQAAERQFAAVAVEV